MKYTPIVEQIDGLTLEHKIQNLCSICDKPIIACPLWRVSVPVYAGNIYICDGIEFGCCEEHANKFQTDEDADMDEYDMKDALPSRDTDLTWIYAFCNKKDYLRDTFNSGKWLPFVSVTDVDASWSIVKEALYADKLGRMAKVSTKPRLTRCASKTCQRKGSWSLLTSDD